ncbi:MAG TPA: hypothetical protein EYP33_05130 [Pyrodictium sp.]|nr:hypothetical protein [Pyrodictium sp.]
MPGYTPSRSQTRLRSDIFSPDLRVGIVVSDPRRGLPRLSEVPVKLSADAEVGPMEYLVAEVKGHQTPLYAVLRVKDLREYNPLGSPDRVDIEERLFGEARSVTLRQAPGVYRIAVTDVIDAFELHDGKVELLGPRILPTSGSPVYKANNRILQVLMGKQKAPVVIGKLVGADVDVAIDL